MLSLNNHISFWTPKLFPNVYPRLSIHRTTFVLWQSKCSPHGPVLLLTSLPLSSVAYCAVQGHRERWLRLQATLSTQQTKIHHTSTSLRFEGHTGFVSLYACTRVHWKGRNSGERLLIFVLNSQSNDIPPFHASKATVYGTLSPTYVWTPESFFERADPQNGKLEDLEELFDEFDKRCVGLEFPE